MNMLLGVAAILKAISWPLVAVFVVYKLQEPLSDFIRRVIRWEASPSGVKTELQAAQQQSEVLQVNEKIDDKDQASVKFQPLDPVYRSEYDDVKNFTEQDQSSTTADQLEATRRLYAIAATERRFEKVHRLIFGSQVDALIHTNQLGGRSKLESIRNIYNNASSSNQTTYKDITFDQWINFIKNVGFLQECQPLGDAAALEITASGRAYLNYALNAQLPPRAL